jgi:hypothetical protein
VAVREERPAWAEPGTAAGRPGRLRPSIRISIIPICGMFARRWVGRYLATDLSAWSSLTRVVARSLSLEIAHSKLRIHAMHRRSNEVLKDVETEAEI